MFTTRRSRRWLAPLTVLAASVAVVALTAAAPPTPNPSGSPTPEPSTSPSPSPTPAPSPSPTPATGELQVTKIDPNGHPVLVPGAVFAIHQGTTDGRVAATITTDQTGTGTATGLPPDTYCVVETAAPQGFQLQPSYTPSQCVGVGADSSQGQNPTRVTVADPPSPPPTGELQVVEIDSGGQNVTTPGFTFNVRVGSASGQVVASLTTDQTGTAVASWLNPSTYCVEETAVPDGWQMQPAYKPDQCVAVAADPTQGRNPATITVSDPVAPAASPSPSEEATAPPTATPSPAAIVPKPTSAPTQAGFGPLGLGLVGFGVALLASGLAMIVVALRRRRLDLGPPPDTWYDSSVS